MANTALRCTNPACSARGEVQTSKTCVVCGRPTSWTVLRVPPTGAPLVVGPFVTTPMPPKKQSKKKRETQLPPGVATRTCMNEACVRFRLAQSDPYCGACGTATVPARTT